MAVNDYIVYANPDAVPTEAGDGKTEMPGFEGKAALITTKVFTTSNESVEGNDITKIGLDIHKDCSINKDGNKLLCIDKGIFKSSDELDNKPSLGFTSTGTYGKKDYKEYYSPIYMKDGVFDTPSESVGGENQLMYYYKGDSNTPRGFRASTTSIGYKKSNNKVEYGITPMIDGVVTTPTSANIGDEHTPICIKNGYFSQVTTVSHYYDKADFTGSETFNTDTSGPLWKEVEFPTGLYLIMACAGGYPFSLKINGTTFKSTDGMPLVTMASLGGYNNGLNKVQESKIDFDNMTPKTATINVGTSGQTYNFYLRFIRFNNIESIDLTTNTGTTTNPSSGSTVPSKPTVIDPSNMEDNGPGGTDSEQPGSESTGNNDNPSFTPIS